MNRNVTFGIISLLLLGLTLAFCQVEQGDFGEIAIIYGAFFCLYVFIVKGEFDPSSTRFPSIQSWIILAVLLRILLVFFLPNLSDDYFRFVWDGRLMINGIHPLEQLPEYYILENVGLAGLDASLYENLNSKAYFTVYPPFCQAVFATACSIFPDSVYGSVVVMKSVFLCLESGSFYLLFLLLRSFKLPEKFILLYALNPLVLLETFNNLHFEIAMVFFVLLSLWLLVNGRWILSAIAMSLGVASKLLPLMFLPFLIRRMGWQSLRYFVVGGLMLLILFVPLLGNYYENFAESLNLYFQRFEFNASVYYLLRKIGFLFSGYNQIAVLGPVLSLIAGSSILYLAWREKSTNWKGLPKMWLFALTIFLLSTTTIHPWYLTGLIALGCLTNLRYPFLWSLLIMGTYMNYAGLEYKEQLWWVGIEYTAVLGYLCWEVFGRRDLKIM